MKKLNYLASVFAATGMLLSTSCSQEDFDVATPNVPCEVTFVVSSPNGVTNRAYSDGLTATELQYAVYDANGAHLAALDGTAQMENGATTVNVQLVSGSDYTLIFWSAAPGAPYTVNFTDSLADANMEVNYNDAKCNDEARDAFFKVFPYKADGNQPETVKLRRPFAQLNIGTNDWTDAVKAGFIPAMTSVKTVGYTTMNFTTGAVAGEQEVTFAMANIVSEDQKFPVEGNRYLAMNYILMGTDAEPVDVFFTCESTDGQIKEREFNVIDLERNHRTNIYGKLLTSSVDFDVEIEEDYEDDDKYGSNDGVVYAKVSNVAEFNAAFGNEGVDLIILTDDIVLDSVVSRAAADPTYTVAKNKSLTIDLGGKKISATSSQTGKNYNMFNVNGGTLTVKNGSMETSHSGENMAWNNSTNIFNVTAGGVLNLQGVTASNLGGSDMAFVAHLNNWGEVTLNVENCVLNSTYVPVRVFNSGPDMNNVTIKNSTLKGSNYAFWVHNYTAEDFGSQSKADAQKELLNLDIYNQGNTFSPDVNGIRYGFTNSAKADACGITKSVSEDGSVVTLGSVVENGVIRRGVAGAEENTVITEVVVTDGVAVLENRTFRRFYALETVVLPNTLTTIGTSIFQSCTALKNVVIPESVTSIGEGAFSECSSLTSINIPSGVTRIEKDALRGTGLTSIEFPAGVNYFGNYAFRDCENLTEMTINAPEFTVHSSNTFLNAAQPYNTMTIYVANAEMKAYLEGVLTDHQKKYITVVAPNVVADEEELIEALENGEDVAFAGNVTIDSASLSNSYGTTGLNVLNGQTIDGRGNVLEVKKANGTWDSGINITGGTLKNLTVTGSFRGIFINHNSDNCSKVFLENVITTGTTYTISCDQGTNNGLEATGCEFYGWTSYAETLGDAKFVDCKFGEGRGYAFCRPYAPTEFVNCDFEEGFELDACASITFENCRLNGVTLTAGNLATLVTSNIQNATVK